MGVVAQPGSNQIEIADEVYKRIDADQKRYACRYYCWRWAMTDQTLCAKLLSEVKETLIIAICLVVLIIFLFFREWIIAFRPLIDIPVSLDWCIFHHVPDGFFHQCTYTACHCTGNRLWLWMMALL